MGDGRTVVVREGGPAEGGSHAWRAWAMNQEAGATSCSPDAFGADLLINSRVPGGRWPVFLGQALECSTALALLELSCPLRPDCSETDAAPADNDTARAAWLRCITAENKVAGAQTGLDQTASSRSFRSRRLWWWISRLSIEPVRVDIAQHAV